MRLQMRVKPTNITELYNLLENIGSFYTDGEHQQLCDIDNKIDEVKDLLEDAMWNFGLEESTDKY